MNTDTGEILRGIAIQEACRRGEPVVEVSEQVARTMEAGKAALSAVQSLSQVTEAQRLARLAGTAK